MNVLTKITREAKLIRKKKPGTSWKNAVKQAGRLYREKKRKSVRQTGTSNRMIDERLTARKPGKRRAASGKTYYERRKNRSDKPGQLTGVSVGSMKNGVLSHYKEKLANRLMRRELATTKTEKKKLTKEIRLLKSMIRIYSKKY